jgi:uncharacterized membrane protein
MNKEEMFNNILKRQLQKNEEIIKRHKQEEQFEKELLKRYENNIELNGTLLAFSFIGIITILIIIVWLMIQLF